jgi:beta-lactamase class A
MHASSEKPTKTFFYKATIVTIVLFLLGVFVGFFISTKEYKSFIYSFKSLRSGGDYSYTNPLLGTDAAEATTIGIYKKVKQDTIKTAMSYQEKGLLQSYGVYVKSLSYPLWFGINDRQEFLPASLYKLPVAISVYRDIEKGNIDRKQKLVYTHKISEGNTRDSLYAPTGLTIGMSYTVEELIKRMITQSDNGAKDLLISVLHEDTIKETLSIVSVDGSIRLTQISPWMYSYYLRILYNATFLNEQNSEELLSLLAESSYKNALVRGIPLGVKVSHKYGLYNEEGGVFELHDCGIIYTQNDPYILCVMTKGTNVEALENFISDVSSIVYLYQVSIH